jgi:type II secretory pathway component PulK
MVGSKPGGQQGFVLVATLWAMAIILALAGAFDAYVSHKLEQATELREGLRDRLDLYSTGQSLRYLLATQRYTLQGLTTRPEQPAEYTDAEGNVRITPVGGELLLDGTAYRGLGDTCFSLQDEAGLVSLNPLIADDLQWLLAAHEKDSRKRDELLASWQDYRDADALSRLNGAEQDVYLQAGIEAPTNYHLRSPGELHRIWGWSSWFQRHPEFRWWRWLGVGRSILLNLNTMPVSLLAAMPGVGEGAARQLVALRRQAPFASIDDFEQRSGLRLDWPEEKYRFGASEQIQLRLWSGGGRQLSVIALELTPGGLLGPWQQRYHYKTAAEIETDLACKPSGVRFFEQPGLPSG